VPIETVARAQGVQGQAGMVIALIGHALAVVVLILAAIDGGVSLAGQLASATPTPTPSPPSALARPVLPPPPTAVATAIAAPTTPPTGAIVEPTVAPTATEVPSPSPTPLPLGAVDTGGRGARLREEPGLRATVVGVLPEAMLVAMLGPEVEQDGRTWRRIRSPDGQEGWVDSGLLTPVGAPSPAGLPEGE
jgi:hypothetical protein